MSASLPKPGEPLEIRVKRPDSEDTLVEKTIFMGQFDTVKPPDSLRTTLGSCVGVLLVDSMGPLYGLAHIVLPKADVTPEQKSSPDFELGKYADLAIPGLLKKMGARTANDYRRIQAKIMGGASLMQMPNGQMATSVQIGLQNIEAVRAILKSFEIKIVAEDLGGKKGRQVQVEGLTGKVWVGIIGSPKKEL